MVNMVKARPIPNHRRAWEDVHPNLRCTQAGRRMVVVERGDGLALVPWIGTDRSISGA